MLEHIRTYDRATDSHSGLSLLGRDFADAILLLLLAVSSARCPCCEKLADVSRNDFDAMQEKKPSLK
jgi:hypothetical protein